jgi:hypothetical protein
LDDLIVGVRCAGERRVTFAITRGSSVTAGQRVTVHDAGGRRSGVVVIAPPQVLEFHAPQPYARVEIDTMAPDSPSGESADLLRSLNLSSELSLD